ncbi:MAG: hypothetical protein M0042_15345 [Nitrospiraceae bacterium]|nr:hypothetical protein [Nitrospiraceae bacterium]
MQAAGQAEKEFGAEIVIIKKTSPEYAREKDPLPCPSVAVNGKAVARNDVITAEALRDAILSEGGR